MERKRWQLIYNYGVILTTLVLGILFLLPDSGYEYGFAIGAWVITLLFALNFFTKLSVTAIFVIMVGYMLAGLLNWPLKEGVKVHGLSDLVPALLPFIGFIILALLYWENRNRF